MSNPIIVTATMPAWVTHDNAVGRVIRYVQEGKHQEAAEEMSFYTGDMDKGSNPWIRVGMAEVTVTLQSKDEMVTNQLRAVQNELDHARAEWLTKQQALLERISKLQALTNEVEA